MKQPIKSSTESTPEQVRPLLKRRRRMSPDAHIPFTKSELEKMVQEIKLRLEKIAIQ